MSAPEKSETPPPAPASAPPPAKSGNIILPVVAVVVLVPVLCYGVMDFLILPKLKSAVTSSAPAKSTGHGGGHGGGSSKEHKKKDSKEDAHSTEFGVTVVNLADSGGSRYLRVNFVIASSDPKLQEIIHASESELRDATITVLSSQTMASLGEPGGRNVARNQLIEQFNRTLGGEVVEQIYFTEFVIQ